VSVFSALARQLGGGASKGALGAAARLAMRAPEDKARFLSEGVEAINGDGWRVYRFPFMAGDRRDVMQIDVRPMITDIPDDRGALVNFQADSALQASAAHKQRVAQARAALDRLKAQGLPPDRLREAARQLQAKIGPAPAEYAPVQGVQPGEQMAIMRRIGAILEADAAAHQPQKIGWVGTSDSRDKLYRSMAKSLTGYQQDSHGYPVRMGERAPQPMRIGARRKAEQLPLLGAAGLSSPALLALMREREAA
jgi:hypothetical protein